MPRSASASLALMKSAAYSDSDAAAHAVGIRLLTQMTDPLVMYESCRSPR